jgi:alkanesulfonate monooxygenase SsuD/methylene tetrahydromethanopterin reductase-like flavin-dependent oxidoreductase (luciferase family)
MAKLYRDHLESSGATGQVVVTREGWIGTNDDEAHSLYRPVVAPIYRYYLAHNILPESSSPTDLETMIDDRALVGSPRSVAERITDLVVQTGADTVVLGIRQPAGPNHQDVMECIARFGAEVAPRVRDQLRAISDIE